MDGMKETQCVEEELLRGSGHGPPPLSVVEPGMLETLQRSLHLRMLHAETLRDRPQRPAILHRVQGEKHYDIRWLQAHCTGCTRY